MNIYDIVIKRHSVRRYLDKKIEEDKKIQLLDEIKKINKDSDLTFNLVTDEPEAFTGPLAHYGKFENCANYITVCGKKGRDEDVGYFGERLVLFAQSIGLNTCWVALTYKRSKLKVTIPEGQKLYIVIAIGYGRNRGLPRKSKAEEQLSCLKAQETEWFKRGMDFAKRAPTAMNQQKFLITLNEDNTVSIKSYLAPCHKIDRGIVKYHFELGAEGNAKWK